MPQTADNPVRPAPAKRRFSSKSRIAAIALASVAAVFGGWRYLGGHGPSSYGEYADPPVEASRPAPPEVDVVRPSKGGVERKCVQPGSVHSFETVELYAMTAGYMKSQAVDIGSHVKKGDLLAEIDAPRERGAVAEARAMVEQARARVRQMEAKVKSMEAARDTAAASAAQTEADVDRLASQRRLAESQYARVKELSERRAVDGKLVDEHHQQLDASIAAENTSRLAVQTAKVKVAAATVDIEQARADVIEAKAAAEVAEARLDKSQIDLDYARIVAPFDGVVTRRNYHPGSFIRSAAGGAVVPVLTVSRQDLMRVVVQIPDRDVVLAGAGDPAAIVVDGLAGKTFKGVVSRVGESEDHTTRTMRLEVDLPNPDGLLREGMYGTVTIGLDKPTERLTVPVACVLDRSGKGGGTVRVVRDGKVQNVKVALGADDGSVVEVDSGLKPEDQIVVRADGTLDEGSEVIVRAAG